MTNSYDAGEDDFLRRAARGIGREEDQNVRSQYLDPLAADPEEEAALRRRAEESGVPAEQLRLEPDQGISVANAANASRRLEMTPRLRAWVADPQNAAVARDDIENLSVFERVSRSVQNLPRDFASGNIYRRLPGPAGDILAAASLPVNPLGASGYIASRQDRGDPLGNEQQRQGELDVEYAGLAYRAQQEARGYTPLTTEERARLDELATRDGQDNWGAFILGPTRRMIPQVVGSFSRGAQEAGRRFDETWDNPFPGMRLVPSAGPHGSGVSLQIDPSDRSTARRVLDGVVTSIAQAPGAAVATFGGGAGGYLSFGYEMETGMAFDQMVRAGVQPDIAAHHAEQYGAWATAIEFASDTLGLRISGTTRLATRLLLGERFLAQRPAVRAAEAVVGMGLEQGVEEAAQQYAQILHEDLAQQEQAGGEPRVRWSEVLTPDHIQQILMSGYVGMQGGVGMGAVPASVNFALDMRAARQAEAGANRFEEMTRAAQASKLNERGLASTMESAVGAMDDSNVYVDADRFAEHFQSAGANAYAVADELGIGEQTLADALASSGQLEIPTSRFAARILRVPQHASLAEHARVTPTAATPAEMQNAEAVLKAQAERIVEETKTIESDNDLGRAIETKMRELFQAAEQEGGPRADVARRYAQLAAALPRAMVARARVTDGAYADRLEGQFRRLFGVDLDIAGPTRGAGAAGAELQQRGVGIDAGPVRSERWDPPEGVKMSDRMREIVEMAVNGASNDWIAAGMDVEPNNIRVTLSQAKAKLGGQTPWERGGQGTPAQPDVSTERLAALYDELSAAGYTNSAGPGGENINTIIARRTGMNVKTVASRLSKHRAAVREAERAAIREPEPESATDMRRQWVETQTVRHAIPGGEPGDYHYGFALSSGRQMYVGIADDGNGAATIDWSFLERLKHVDEDNPTALYGDGNEAFSASEWREMRVAIRAIFEADMAAYERPAYVFTPQRESNRRSNMNMIAEMGDGLGYKLLDDQGSVYLIHPDAGIAANGRIQPQDGWAPTFEEPQDYGSQEDADAAQAAFYASVEAADVSADGPNLSEIARATRKERREAEASGATAAQDAGGNGLSQNDKRGSIRYENFRAGEFGQAMIRMGKSSDLSTFLHEFGHLSHLVLESMATDAAAPAEFKAMWSNTLQWWGLTQAEWDALTPEQKVPHFERWARTFESYLMEGKAPSFSLRESFAAFKAWLTQIYRQVFRLDANLNPQIRDVFDRMLATDQEIAEARAAMGADFALAREAFKSDEEFAQYQQAIVDARDAADAELRARVMDAQVRKDKRWWRAERERVRKTAEIEVDTNPARRAFEWLSFNDWRALPVEENEDGQVLPPNAAEQMPEGLPDMRLDWASLREEERAGLPAEMRPLLNASDVDAALESAMAFKRQGRQRQPQRLWAFIKSGVTINGVVYRGIKDEGGEVGQALGSARARPGLINNESGLNADEWALRAWEAGYFGRIPGQTELNQERPDAGGGQGEQTFYRGISDGREETGFYTDSRNTASAYSERGENPNVLERYIDTEGFRDIPFSKETFVEAVVDADRRGLPGLIVRGVPDVSGLETQIYVRDKGRLRLAQQQPDGGSAQIGFGTTPFFRGAVNEVDASKGPNGLAFFTPSREFAGEFPRALPAEQRQVGEYRLRENQLADFRNAETQQRVLAELADDADATDHLRRRIAQMGDKATGHIDWVISADPAIRDAIERAGYSGMWLDEGRGQASVAVFRNADVRPARAQPNAGDTQSGFEMFQSELVRRRVIDTDRGTVIINPNRSDMQRMTRVPLGQRDKAWMYDSVRYIIDRDGNVIVGPGANMIHDEIAAAAEGAGFIIHGYQYGDSYGHGSSVETGSFRRVGESFTFDDLRNPHRMGSPVELFQGGELFAGEDGKRPTPRELLDALIDDIKNIRQVYSSKDAEALAANQSRADALKWFEARGIDISGTKEDIRAQIVAAMEEEQGRENAVDADTAASWFGFSSGAEMLDAIKALKPRSVAIEENIDARLEGEYGDPLKDGTVAESARLAAHIEAQARRIEIELEAIQRATGGKKTPVGRAARAYAERQVQHMTVKQLRAADQFLAAERRAARAALEATAKKDFQTAALMKQRQLISFHLFRLASDAAEEMDRTQRYFGKFERDTVRARIHAPLLDQIDQVLEGIDLRAKPRVSDKKRQSFMRWFESMQAEGLEHMVVTDPDFLDGVRDKPFAALTLEEVRGMRDAVRNFEHIGRRWREVLAARDARLLDEAVAEMTASMAQVKPFEIANPDNHSPGVIESIDRGRQSLHAQLSRVEAVSRAMDRQKDNGPVWNGLFRPLTEARDREELRQQEAQKAIEQLFSVYSAEERADMWVKRKFYPQVPNRTGSRMGRNFTKQEILALALNTGNEYNLAALLEGERKNSGMSEQQLRALLDVAMDQRDWEFVQSAWDYVNSFWPEIEALYVKTAGVAPGKVPPTPFKNKYGEWRGGYWHLEYDYGRDQRVRDEADHGMVQEAFGGFRLRTQTPNGFSKARQGSGGRPVRLDLAILTEHVNEVIHDLEFRVPVLNTWRLIKHSQFRDAFVRAAGQEMYDTLKPWLQFLATERIPPERGFSGVIKTLRRNTPIALMGYAISTIAQQPAGLMGTFHRVGTGRVMGKALQLMSQPWTWMEHARFINTRSPMMRNRASTSQRELREMIREINSDKHVDAVRLLATGSVRQKAQALGYLNRVMQRYSMFPLAFLDKWVSSAAWKAAYDKALAGHVDGVDPMNEADVIAYADQMIRTTFGSGRPEDMAPIMRSSELGKLITPAFSYFNTQYNQLYNEQVPGMMRGHISPLEFVTFITFTLVMQALVSQWLAGRWEPDDGEDDEDRNTRLAMEVAMTPVAGVPLIRDMTRSAMRTAVTGERFTMSTVPAFGAVGSTASGVGGSLNDLAEDGEISRQSAKDLTLAAGYWFGLPSRQMWTTGSYLTDVASGNEDLPWDSSEPIQTTSEALVRDSR